MYRKKWYIYGSYYAWFQACTGTTKTYSPLMKGGYHATKICLPYNRDIINVYCKHVSIQLDTRKLDTQINTGRQSQRLLAIKHWS